MTRWTYRELRVPQKQEHEYAPDLERLGQEGWEVYAVREVGVAYGPEIIFYLKRPIEGWRRKPYDVI